MTNLNDSDFHLAYNPALIARAELRLSLRFWQRFVTQSPRYISLKTVN